MGLFVCKWVQGKKTPDQIEIESLAKAKLITLFWFWIRSTKGSEEEEDFIHSRRYWFRLCSFVSLSVSFKDEFFRECGKRVHVLGCKRSIWSSFSSYYHSQVRFIWFSDHFQATIFDTQSSSSRSVTTDDVSLTITHCGVCYADVIWSRNQHGDSKYPLVPGYVFKNQTLDYEIAPY